MKQLFLKMNEDECATTFGGEVKIIWVYENGAYKEVLINV